MAVDGDIIESYNEYYTIIHDGTDIIDYINGYDFEEGRQQIVVPFQILMKLNQNSTRLKIKN